MKFFMPHAKTADRAEEIYQAIKSYAKKTIGGDITERRIHSIEFIDRRSTIKAEVGKILPINNEEVMAILESATFF